MNLRRILAAAVLVVATALVAPAVAGSPATAAPGAARAAAAPAPAPPPDVPNWCRNARRGGHTEPFFCTAPVACYSNSDGIHYAPIYALNTQIGECLYTNEYGLFAWHAVEIMVICPPDCDDVGAGVKGRRG